MILDLFAGPGGMDLGARLAGYEATGIERDADAVATRREAGLPTVHGDVRSYGPDDFPGADILAGGPPCQTFSVTGRGEGRQSMECLLTQVKDMAARRAPSCGGLDGRSLLVLEPLRYILAAIDARRPYRAVVLEQVPQVLPVWRAYVEVLRAEGYGAACANLNATAYGVPQSRLRAVLVARLDGPATLPAPTHRRWSRGPGNDAVDLPKWVSMGEALNRPEPFTVISNYSNGGDPKNRGRRNSSEPAFTVTGKIDRFRVVSPDGQETRFTWSEAGILQGFPAHWPWTGRTVLSKAQQIGNACPPPLAAALLRGVGAKSVTLGVAA